MQSGPEISSRAAEASAQQPTALLISFHFPPFGLSSGVLRTLKLVKHLPSFGWSPLVLTAHPRAYVAVRDDQLADIPRGTVVERAFCLDTARHLAVGSRYLKHMAIPDRWASWWFGGIYSGMKLIRRHRPQVIWSTFPIASAHLIALTLHRRTGIPWIADIRDPMTEDGYPKDPLQRRALAWLERRCSSDASATVFTTPGAARMHAHRCGNTRGERIHVIENGYDEDDFRHATPNAAAVRRPADSPLVLVHSGLLYPEERDPREFYAALRALKAANEISRRSVRIVLRGTGHDTYHARQLEAFGIEDIVELKPVIPYDAALRELFSADGLLLFQAATCNHQIPAKVYEYLRVQRPILALTDECGDTAALLKSVGMHTITHLDDRTRIQRDLASFLARVRSGTAPIVASERLPNLTRRARTSELVSLFHDVTTQRDRPRQ